MLRVAELMTRSVLTLTRGMSVAEATERLSDAEVSAAPVLDADGRVVGVFSASDVVAAVGDPEALPETVGDAMSREVLATRPEDAVADAVKKMVFEGVHRLVVLGEDGELAGIFTAMDVLRALAEGRAVLDEAPPSLSARAATLGKRTGPGTPSSPLDS